MGEPAHIATWRVRAIASAGAVLACVGLFALLVISSRTFIAREHSAAGVEVFLSPPERPRDAPQRPGVVRGPAAAPSDAAPPAAPSVEAEMLSRMLRCARRAGQPRPPDCPRETRQEDWERPNIAVGGDYVQPEQPDHERIYTRAEQQTLVMPSCIRDGAGGCVRFGVRPPPPSRSAEQICREGGLGGPCTPPPEQPAAP